MSKRIVELDGLRGLAVLGVLMWHFVGGMVDRRADAVQDILHASTIFGRTGVDLFFVLSGFLIMGILIDHRISGNLFQTFYARRIARIWPPYALLICAYWLCYLAVGETDGFNTRGGVFVQLFAQLTFTWNWLMAIADGGVADGFSITWSVAIEEWFYIIFPALIWLTPSRYLAHLLIAVACGSALMRAGLHLAMPQLWQAPYVLTPLRFDGLCAGGLLAIAVRDRSWMLWFEHNAKVLSRAALAFALSLPLVLVAIRPALDAHMYVWGHLYMAIGFTLLIAVVLNRVDQATGIKFLRWRGFTEAGRYSYSLYLFHPLFLSLFFIIAGRPERISDFGSLGVAVGSLATTLIFCIGLYWLVERRAIAWGHRRNYNTAEPELMPRKLGSTN